MAITPYLYYRDVAAARRFLAKAFGFKNFGAANKNKAGRLIHAAMKLPDSAVVMMGSPGARYKNPRLLGQATQCLLIDVADVERHYARAKEAGAKIVDDLKKTPFGMHRYGAEDPEGHQWYFAQEQPGRRR